MRIFVAGGSGAVGRLLLPKLLQAGHEVVAITRSEQNAHVMTSVGVRVLVADIYDREAIIAAVSEARPDVVIHQLTSLSAMDFAENSRIRKEGTRNLVDAALAAGVKRIVAQSISWAYEPGEGPASEDAPLDVNAPEPRNSMVGGVAALERAVAKMPEYVILRYGKFYGPGTWYERNGHIARQVLGKEVPATDGVSSFIHVEDAANAALLALGWPSGPVNIVDDEPAAMAEWLPVYASAMGAPKPDYKPGRERGECGAKNAKARIEYGWEPIYPTWRSGFARSL
ncbi:NAD-dependent epimerase/dehydratase family protein [Paenibacillus nasutitermitis]|uniref:dTDP-glucose 4,6-dehydratase n=1 Tax=Paenibacillus nasutitermitis TaxID=1652958 RepID=A0A916ZAP9_9BACL|nr:NAD(P)-dependent oxidoreductase [Paenibacillus nasutitermitis]GGD84842.1 dTDP-glucose 4,6-dehydratase [Paenibacillus nasutitermitis]